MEYINDNDLISNDDKEEYRINDISSYLNQIAEDIKEELATVAETLVNLTSFKRRVSLDKETVGGPIDVAVISKGDGFIWEKESTTSKKN